jgi:hypothetical protein
MGAVDRNNLAWWFPLIERGGLPVPRTEIVRTELPLDGLLDGPSEGRAGITPDDFRDFLFQLIAAADHVRYGQGPFFLRTGHLSGKHSWADTCYVQSVQSLGDHVYRLIEESHMVDLMGLPTDTWAVRALIPTRHLFKVEEWSGFPVTREFRVFIRDDGGEEITVHPYWPEAALPGMTWEERVALYRSWRISEDELGEICTLAGQASGAVGGGFWSVDFLEDVNGRWWLTDMADGDRSFRNPLQAILK